MGLNCRQRLDLTGTVRATLRSLGFIQNDLEAIEEF